MTTIDPPTFDIKAKFKMDHNQKPDCFEETAGGKVIHIFTINLILVPSPTSLTPQRVTFFLDESYYQPVREARRHGNQFEEEITSYGNFTLVAKFQAGEYITAQTAQLSDLLTKGHEGAMTSAIQKAIEYIEAN